VKEVSVDGTVELEGRATLIGRPFFGGWDPKNRNFTHNEIPVSSPIQVLKDVSVGGTVGL
jgi:hypothetical protein